LKSKLDFFYNNLYYFIQKEDDEKTKRCYLPDTDRSEDLQGIKGVCREPWQTIDPVCYFLCDNFIFKKRGGIND